MTEPLKIFGWDKTGHGWCAFVTLHGITYELKRIGGDRYWLSCVSGAFVVSGTLTFIDTYLRNMTISANRNNGK